jgi:multimeric flavodoxin WrbA
MTDILVVYYSSYGHIGEITGGTPYGASCVTGAGAELRMPTELELDMCRFQGGHVATIARSLVRGRAAGENRRPPGALRV